MIPKSSVEIISEALFFRLYSSYLLRSPEFKDNYELLLNHYQKYPGSFRLLNKFDLLRLKQIQEDIKLGRYSLFSGSMNFSESEISEIKAEKGDKTHKEICQKLFENKENAFRMITPEKIIRCALEFPCLYGSIDILLSDSLGCEYILEIKTGQAKHDIIGQVCKYYISQALKLNLRLFNDVKIVTLCPGYTEDTYKGLLQIGSRPLILNTKSLEIKDL